MSTFQRARRIATPGLFAQSASRGRWTMAPHLALIDREVMRFLTMDTHQILMIEAPPRHGKSLYSSKWLPTWYLGMHPNRRIILSAYGADYAKELGGSCRDLLIQHGPEYFRETVSRNHASSGHWQVSGNSGAMYSVGVGGPITGRGADLFILDDPIKNSADAASETLRAKQWDWWESTACTRLEPGGKVIILNTRWHRHDLCGKILNQSADKDGRTVKRITLPALAEADDLLGREIDEPLWPERYDREALELERAAKSRYFWLAMYQQRPTAHERTAFPDEYFQDILV